MDAFLSHSPEETRRHAAEVCNRARAGAVILLEGELGAGKTEWVRGFVEAAGASNTVSSPTFTLLHHYRGGKWDIFHWDLYRLNETTDWSALDLEEQLRDGKGVMLIEWPERYPHAWPREAWRIRFEDAGAKKRQVVCIF